MKKLISILFCFFLLGCGNDGSSPSNGTSTPPPPPPSDIISASVEQSTIQLIDVGWIDARFYFSVIFKNTGNVDLTNIVYAIEGENKDTSWSRIELIDAPIDAVGKKQYSYPFNIPVGTSITFSGEFFQSLSTIYQITGLAYPRNYNIRIRLFNSDKTLLATSAIMTISMP